MRQRDTYFHAVQGQLKLREAPPALPELIAYVPAELAGPKVSHKAWELDKTERRGHEHKANDVDKPGGLERTPRPPATPPLARTSSLLSTCASTS